MSRILIKIGSHSVVDDNGSFSKNIFNLINEVCALKDQKHQICLIVSGAQASFAAYRRLFSDHEGQKTKIEKCSIGQVFLTNCLFKICKKNKKMLSSLLISNSDMIKNGKEIYSRIAELIQYEDTVLCINGNDFSSEGNLLNNDFLAKEMNNIIKFDFVFILSSIEGVLDRNKKIINILNENSLAMVDFFKKTNLGNGGMEEKIENCKEIAKSGTKCYILPACHKNAITKVLNGKKLGTLIDF